MEKRTQSYRSHCAAGLRAIENTFHPQHGDQESTMIKQFALTTAVLAAFFGAGGLAKANLLVNGDFENEPNFGPGATINDSFFGFVVLSGSQLPGWTIEPGHGLTIHNPANPTISGTYTAELDGEGYNGHSANFYQDFASVKGASYAFSFDWKSWENNAPATKFEVSVSDPTTGATLFDALYGYSGFLTLQ
jgi:hypothetical protein